MVHLNGLFAGIVVKGSVQEGIADAVHSVLYGKTLKLAVAALGTEHAEMVSAGEHELQNLLTVRLQLIRRGMDHHPVVGGSGTGREKLRVPLHLYDAHTAGSYRREPL